MAEVKISQLPAADAIQDANLIEVVQTVSNRKGTFAQIKTWIQSWLTKAMVGLGNVDNTADSAKPVSTAVQTALNLKADTTALASYLTISTAASTYLPISQKGAANGVVPLGADSKIASTYLPSYVDDVLEYAAVANFPVPGETGKIYVATGTNKVYRWPSNGTATSSYIEISGSPGSTDAVPEGASNLYFTNARAVAALSSTLAAYLTTSAANTTYMPRSGGTFTGQVAVPAGFTINAGTGDTGGYLTFAKAPNGTLTAPTILQYQNKFLFYERGGSGRGAYLDLASLTSWANNRIVTTTDLASYATQAYVTTAINSASSSMVDASATGGSTALLVTVTVGKRFIIDPLSPINALTVRIPYNPAVAYAHGDTFELVLGNTDIASLTTDTSGGTYPIRPALTADELNSKRAIKFRLWKSTEYDGGGNGATSGWYREAS